MNITRSRSAAFLGGTLAAALLLSGCAGKPREPQAGADSFNLATTVPPATGDADLVTWNLSGGEPATLDPVGAFSGSELQVGSNLCESLLTMNEQGEVEPALATSIEQPSPTEYLVHLREGVSFTDGTPMTADDVVYSLDRIRDPEAGSYWGYFAERVDSVAAVDQHTVSIQMTEADAVFYRMLTTPVGQIVQKSFVEKHGDDYGTPETGVMCTGPYTLAKWIPGDSLRLEANDQWWNIENQPLRTKSVKFTFLTDDATITSALLNGDVQGNMNLASTSLPQLTQSSSGAAYVGPSTMQFALVPTNLSSDSQSPLADPLIRQALAKSIDYQGLLTTSWAGLGEPLRTIVPPGAWGYGHETFQVAYDEFKDPTRDAEEAKALLAKAGNPNPKIVLAIPAEIPQYVTIGESIQSNAKDAGFDLELRALPSAESSALYADQTARNKVDAFLTDYFSDIPDPLQLYMQIGTPNGASNYNLYDNPEVASLLEEARGTGDDEVRAQLTVEAQRIMTEDLVWLPIAYPLQSVFLSNSLGGMTTSATVSLHTPWLAKLGAR